jgi:ABC-type multidrug transport system permease subunit
VLLPQRHRTTNARGGAHHPLVELTLARLREFVREPEALFWSFFFPIVMSVAMAMAFPSQGSQPVRVGVPQGAVSETLRTTLSADPSVIVREVPPGEELRQLREGDVHVIVQPGHPPTYRFDPDRSESRIARLVVDDVLKRAGGRADPWQAREDPLAIPGSRYVDWLIPGIVALGIMNNSMWSIGFMTVQMRLRKLLKRLAASPMRKWEFLLAQLQARLLFLGPEVAVPLVFGVLAFGMPVRGPIVGIALVALIGALAFGSIGLLVGSRVRTLEAVSGLMNLIMVPMWVLSGVFFSSANFPDIVQPLIRALPLTALVDALRAVVLEGAAVGGIQRELMTLAVWTIVPFSLGLRIFKWR